MMPGTAAADAAGLTSNYGRPGQNARKTNKVKTIAQPGCD